jgi:nucleoside-diphosphate-sugar epimerase
MRILLIGGTGFIGPHVAAALRREGHEVVVFHRSRSLPTDIVGDRKNIAVSRSALRECAPDVVVDLILSSGAQARELMQTFRGAARRVVALSSCDVYRAGGVFYRSEAGPLQPLPLTESSDLRKAGRTYPAEQFARIKTIFGWLDDDYEKIDVEREILADPELPGTALRLPMVYGPGDPLRRVGGLLDRFERETSITFEGRHAAWRAPRGYVEDVGAAIALATVCDRAAGRVYNIAETEGLSELEWARSIASEAGWTGSFATASAGKAPPELLSPANFDQHWDVDSSRIRQELGYQESIDRPEALRRSIAWEKQKRVMADG